MPNKDPIVNRETQRRWYKNNRDKGCANTKLQREKKLKWFRELKLNYRCIVCGEDEPYCIDFHHLDPKNKLFGVGATNAQRYPKQKILDEIKKCVPLCSNCHRKLHAGLIKLE